MTLNARKKSTSSTTISAKEVRLVTSATKTSTPSAKRLMGNRQGTHVKRWRADMAIKNNPPEEVVRTPSTITYNDADAED